MNLLQEIIVISVYSFILIQIGKALEKPVHLTNNHFYYFGAKKEEQDDSVVKEKSP
jgi:hypothetical protein